MYDRGLALTILTAQADRLKTVRLLQPSAFSRNYLSSYEDIKNGHTS